MEYKIIVGMRGFAEFEEQINALMADRWRTAGGVSVTASTELRAGAIVYFYYQAMIREIVNPE